MMNVYIVIDDNATIYDVFDSYEGAAKRVKEIVLEDFNYGRINESEVDTYLEELETERYIEDYLYIEEYPLLRKER